MADSALYHTYNWLLVPVGCISSLLCSSVVLHRARRKRRREQQPSQPGAGADRLFDTLLVVLSGIQVYTYSVMCLFLPVLWFCPSTDLIFRNVLSGGMILLKGLSCVLPSGDARLHSGLFNHVSTKTNSRQAQCPWVLVFLHLTLLVSALWLALFWHATIALSLYSLVVRKDPPPLIQSRLRVAMVICPFLTLIKLVLDLLGAFYPPTPTTQTTSGCALFLFVFVLVSWAYGATILTLFLRSGGAATGFRTLRDRLLLCCTYLLVYVAFWTVKVAAGVAAKQRFASIDVVAGLVVAYQGAFDSAVMGNLWKGLWCNEWCKRWLSGAGRKPLTDRQRQVQDSRIRVGRSVISRMTGHRASHFASHSTAVASIQEKEVEMGEMGDSGIEDEEAQKVDELCQPSCTTET